MTSTICVLLSIVLAGALLRIKRLKSAIREHRDARGNDRCWLDDGKVIQESWARARSINDPSLKGNLFNKLRQVPSEPPTSLSSFTFQRCSPRRCNSCEGRMIRAPWTEDQVNSLNGYQACGFHHPFTFGDEPNKVDLIATTDGWVAIEGGSVVQDWAHSFMLNWEWKLSDPYGPDGLFI